MSSDAKSDMTASEMTVRKFLKQLGVTDIVSISAVGSLKEEHSPGKFVIVDQFIDRTFARNKTFFDDEIVAHVSMGHPTSNGLMNA